MKNLDTLVAVLLMIGGLNWGLVGLFDFNLVTTVFGTMPMLSKIVYALVGLSGAYSLINLKSTLAAKRHESDHE